jgi:dihydrofolate synthase/folylpolyglutamate synthase
MTELVTWLYGLQSHGIKLGLGGIRGLLDILERPERDLDVVLIGGTNGKGSVSAMLDALLLAHGRRTGLYTSPHLVRPNERIRIAGTDVSDEGLERSLSTVRRACERGLGDGRLEAQPSFFEVMTAAALVSFREAGTDAVILEVGLGGRLDATNATEPLVSAIVSVDLDHTQVLGTTLARIAAEKAAIARPFRPLVSGVSTPEALDVIRAHCEKIGALLIDARASVLPAGMSLALTGEHQWSNAQVALVAFERFAEALDLDASPGSVLEGFAATRWPGRLQWIPGSPSVLLDGAHNAAGAAVLAAHLAERGGPKPVAVFGSMADKDARALLAPLAPYVSAVVTTKPPVLRADDPERLAALARELGLEAETEADPVRALDRACAKAGPGGVVLVTGSLYLVGVALAAHGGDPAPGPVSM